MLSRFGGCPARENARAVVADRLEGLAVEAASLVFSARATMEHHSLRIGQRDPGLWRRRSWAACRRGVSRIAKPGRHFYSNLGSSQVLDSPADGVECMCASFEASHGDDRIRQELSGRALRAEAVTTLVNQVA